MKKQYTKKQYTKKQIREAIAYWEKQLEAGNYRKVDESGDGDLDGEEFFIEIKDRVTSDQALLGKFEAAYRALEPGWDGDMNDDRYLDWEYDFIQKAAARAAVAGGGVSFALAVMKPALDCVVRTGRDDYWD